MIVDPCLCFMYNQRGWLVCSITFYSPCTCSDRCACVCVCEGVCVCVCV